MQKKQDKKMNRIVTTLLFGLATINTMVMADTSSSRPRLVVGIMVDQLRTDYLEYLQNLFGQRGFRRLMDSGVYMRDVDFMTRNADAVNATASAFTGASPSSNGLPSSEIWNSENGKLMQPLADSHSLGNFTSIAYSPTAIRTSTLADEIAIDGLGLSQIHSIAADPQQAIIMSGHSGSSAIWLDKNSGKWATTTYYGDIPANVSRRNYSNSVASRIDTMVWKPLLPLSSYPGIPAQKRHYEFRHTFPKNDKNVFSLYSISPKINEEITDIAIEYLTQTQLGNRDAIDMLNLAYTAAPYKDVRDGDFRLELQDTYIRLDRQLERLFNVIESKVGFDNTIIYLAGTGYYDDSVPVDEKYKIPTGVFSIKRATSLLNSYLAAKYGNGDYVSTFHADQLWLNHKEIEKKGLNIDDVVVAACDFVRKMSGVAQVRTLSEALSASGAEGELLRNSLDPHLSGDLLIDFAPGWNVKDDLQFPADEKNIRGQAALTPAFLLAPGLKSEKISTTVNALQLAPTVAGLLHIRSPNGANRKQLLF